MKSTLLTLATIAILAQQAQAKASTPIDGCLEKFKVPETGYAEGGCFLLADQKGVTFKDLLAWNKDLREDCLNLDVGNDICVKGPNKDAPEAEQSTPIQPQVEAAPGKGKPQAVTTDPAMAVTTDPAMAGTKAKPQAQSTRPLYPNMAKTVKPLKAMASSPMAESDPLTVPGGANEAQSYN